MLDWVLLGWEWGWLGGGEEREEGEVEGKERREGRG
jgi:hypothetical protein